MDQNKDKWAEIQMYCPKCGTLNIGFRNEGNMLRYECKNCKVAIVRTYKSRRHEVFELLIPKTYRKQSAINRQLQ